MYTYMELHSHLRFNRNWRILLKSVMCWWYMQWRVQWNPELIKCFEVSSYGRLAVYSTLHVIFDTDVCIKCSRIFCKERAPICAMSIKINMNHTCQCWRKYNSRQALKVNIIIFRHSICSHHSLSTAFYSIFRISFDEIVEVSVFVGVKTNSTIHITYIAWPADAMVQKSQHTHRLFSTLRIPFHAFHPSPIRVHDNSHLVYEIQNVRFILIERNMEWFIHSREWWIPDVI